MALAVRILVVGTIALACQTGRAHPGTHDHNATHTVRQQLLGHLSPQQTIGAVFEERELDPGKKWHIYRRANPACVATIRRILAEKELQPYWPAALCILGYLGTDEDCERIASVLDQNLSHEATRRSTVLAALNALGIMASNKSAKAAATLEAMIKGDYWRGRRTPAAELLANRKITGIDALRGEALLALALANRQRAFEVSRLVVGSYGKDRFVEHKRWFFGEERISRYVERQVKIEGTTPSSNEYDRARRNYRVYLPRLQQLSIFSAPRPEQLKAQALKAFSGISSTIGKGVSPACYKLFVKGATPVSQLNPERWEDEYMRDFERYRSMLADLAERKLISTGRMAAAVKDARVELNANGDPVVSWPISSSKVIRDKHLPRSAYKETGAANGDLLIVMKFINDKWYWSGFGQ